MSYALCEFLTSGEWRQPWKQLRHVDQLDLDNNLASGIVTRLLQHCRKGHMGKLHCLVQTFLLDFMIWLFSVRPKPRTIPMTVINKSMKTRLQTIDRRVTYISHVAVKQSQNVWWRYIITKIKFFGRRKHFYVLTVDRICFENANKFVLKCREWLSITNCKVFHFFTGNHIHDAVTSLSSPIILSHCWFLTEQDKNTGRFLSRF